MCDLKISDICLGAVLKFYTHFGGVWSKSVEAIGSEGQTQ